ncbi:MAG: hypothetical protein CMJ78_08355 [Planctomycetaceae bacterium]|nr:hypothetical protein [Planctomycetaceae bacterium]
MSLQDECSQQTVKGKQRLRERAVRIERQDSKLRSLSRTRFRGTRIQGSLRRKPRRQIAVVRIVRAAKSLWGLHKFLATLPRHSLHGMAIIKHQLRQQV